MAEREAVTRLTAKDDASTTIDKVADKLDPLEEGVEIPVGVTELPGAERRRQMVTDWFDDWDGKTATADVDVNTTNADRKLDATTTKAEGTAKATHGIGAQFAVAGALGALGQVDGAVGEIAGSASEAVANAQEIGTTFSSLGPASIIAGAAVGGAMLGMKIAAQQTADTLAKVKTTIDNVAGAADTQAVNDFSNAMVGLKISGKNLDDELANIARTTPEALQKIIDLDNGSGFASDTLQKLGISTADLTAALKNQGVAATRTKDAQDKANATMNAGAAAAQGTATGFFSATTAALGYKNTVDGVPTSKKTDIAVSSNADAVGGDIDNAARPRSTTINIQATGTGLNFIDRAFHLGPQGRRTTTVTRAAPRATPAPVVTSRPLQVVINGPIQSREELTRWVLAANRQADRLIGKRNR